MRRYRFLQKDDVFAALNRLRDAFMAAHNGSEVEEIINGLLTNDEKLKIGRRILVASYLKAGFTLDEIVRDLKVGRNTVISVMKNLDAHSTFFELIERRSQKVEKTFTSKKFRELGSSLLVQKKKVYSGLKRKKTSKDNVSSVN